MYWVWWIVICASVLIIAGIVGIALCIRFDKITLNDYYDTTAPQLVASCIVGGLGLLIFIISGIFACCGEYERYHEPIYWQNFYTMCQEVVTSGNALTNAGMTSKVVEYNKWLVDARTDQEVKGMWSQWHDIDLSNFEYITLDGGTEFDITFGNNG